ncbi:MAG: phosphoribosylglycinamide formyltransferase [Actinomycetia bacterium]|nr:phosphoribosylglycinamide formyltransferase [Actinomycetes bacterium]MCP4959537.1 phosphoribosylglycinamide formyltransferase [Actinomycetes bacterium]
MTGRLVVLASGNGTNCQALIDACDDGCLDAEIVAIITDVSTAGVIDRANTHNITVEVVSHVGKGAEQRAADDLVLASVIASYAPDLVVLAGWMRLLGRDLCNRFPVVNVHPALPGEFTGTRAIERAYDTWVDGRISRSGVMVHWVPDEAVDAGPVIVQRQVAFVDGDTLDTFEDRIHRVEHTLIVEGVRLALDSAPPISTGLPSTGRSLPPLVPNEVPT